MRKRSVGVSKRDSRLTKTTFSAMQIPTETDSSSWPQKNIEGSLCLLGQCSLVGTKQASKAVCFGSEGGTLAVRNWCRLFWEIVEGLRRGHGDGRSLDAAPAQWFRHDELVSLNAFLLQAIAFGWVADYVPASAGFFVHFKDNRQACFTADSADTLKELRTTFGEWNPTDEDPMILRAPNKTCFRIGINQV